MVEGHGEELEGRGERLAVKPPFWPLLPPKLNGQLLLRASIQPGMFIKSNSKSLLAFECKLKGVDVALDTYILFSKKEHCIKKE